MRALGALGALAALWAAGLVVVILVAGDGHVGKIEMLQGRRMRGAIQELERVDENSVARMQQLAPASDWKPANWLEEIVGKDTTHDMDYIKNLKPGDVSESGFEGLPHMTGVLPSENEMASAQTLLKRAIDTNTMPADIGPVWDGKPYVPDQEFLDKLSGAWGLFHAAMGEKKWEKLVHANCKDGAAKCKEILDGKNEGYDTKWDGTQWNQFDGQKWGKLEHDSLLP